MKIVITAHGNLATSILNTVHMILGDTDEQVEAIDFDANASIEDLQKRIEQALDDTLTYIFCDLKGGTPFNASYRLAQAHPIKIICGMNVGMLLECLMEFYRTEDAALMDLALQTGKNAIEGFTFEGK